MGVDEFIKTYEPIELAKITGKPNRYKYNSGV